VKTTLIWLGGLALLAATLTDFLAVIGRHVGVPINGSIELMQAVVLLSGSVSLVMATWDDAHARVHLLTERMTPALRSFADALSDLVSLAFLLALLSGSLWLAADLWGGHEQSELLGVPWAALRLIANLALAGTCVLLVVRLAQGLRR